MVTDCTQMLHGTPRIFAPATGAPAGMPACPFAGLPSAPACGAGHVAPVKGMIRPQGMAMRQWMFAGIGSVQLMAGVQGVGAGRSAPIARRC